MVLVLTDIHIAQHIHSNIKHSYIYFHNHYISNNRHTKAMRGITVKTITFYINTFYTNDSL